MEAEKERGREKNRRRKLNEDYRNSDMLFEIITTTVFLKIRNIISNERALAQLSGY